MKKFLVFFSGVEPALESLHEWGVDNLWRQRINNPSQHPMDILNVHQPFQLTNSATRITESTSSCLDLIMTQSLHIVSRIEVHPAICSDPSVPCAYIRNSVIENKHFKE